jgi:hypothetical protein
LRNAKAFAAIQTISSNFFIRSRFAQLHSDETGHPLRGCRLRRFSLMVVLWSLDDNSMPDAADSAASKISSIQKLWMQLKMGA